MAITKEKKREIVKTITSELEGSSATFFTDFTGVSANGMNDLRRKVREGGARYFVAKYSLVKKAFDDSEIEVDDALLDGINGLVISNSEPIDAAKVLADFKKEHKAFTIKGGIMGSVVLSDADVAVLAKTPPREVLLAKMLGSMNAPITGFVGVSAAIIRKAMYAINAVKESKQ